MSLQARMAGGPAARRLSRLAMTIIGAGRAGSFAALVAGMAGARRLTVYDDDRLDPDRNTAVQFYRIADLEARRPKVEALRELLGDLLPSVLVLPRAEAYRGRRDQPVDPVVLLSVDSMEARAAIWEPVLRRRGVSLLLDVRLGGPVMRCYIARGPADAAWYRSTLHGDGEGWGAACADSPDPHVAVGAAAFVAGAVLGHVRGRGGPRMIGVDFDTAAFVVERREAPGAAPPA